MGSFAAGVAGVYIDMDCDSSDCTKRAVYLGPSLPAFVRAARAAGWIVDLAGDRCVCPRCVQAGKGKTH